MNSSLYAFRNKSMKNWQLVIIALCATLFFITAHNAYAVVNISWDSPDHSIFDGNVSPFLTATTSKFTVTDTSLDHNNVVDTINVLVNSTSDPTGITLTLTETGPNTGIFVNTNLIFTNGTKVFGIPSTQTIGISKPSLAGTGEIISGPSSSEGIQVFSTTNSSGIFMNLTETGHSTGLFTAKLKFTSGSSINGSSISVHPGDTVTIMDVNNLDVENEMVLPNPDSAFGALPAKINDFVSATYGGVKATTRLDAFTSPGGGGGGLIRPGLVLDLLAALGGSPFIVSPPSFGGGIYHYSDGLTITEGNDKTTFDTSKYNQEIPKQVMVTGQRVNMTFKTFESYNPTAVIHMGLYIIPRGQDMLTTNSIASITYDKNSPVEVNDPNHILSNTSALSTTDGKFQYTQFLFVPTKSYDKMSFLARAWNDHRYSTDIRVHDGLSKPPTPRTLPTGVVLYEDYYDLQATLEKDQFYKSQIMAHIHSTFDVFGSSDGGHIYWLYDTIKHSVTLVIVDKNDNVLASYTVSLVPHPSDKKGDYGFMKFTATQLNRWDEKQEEHAKETEAAKAMLSALEKGLIVPSNWQS